MVSPARGAWRLLCLMVPAALSAQRPPAPPTVRLDRPVWRAREPLSSVVGTRALSSGAVLVTDLSDVRLALLEPSGESRLIGRAGAGPREYATPTALIALPGDSTMLIDRDARRYLVITPTGQLLDARRFPDAMQSGAEHVRGADRLGRVYFQTSGLPALGGSPFVALQRWDRRSSTFDSIGAVRMPNPQPVKVTPTPEMERELPGMVLTARRIMPFSPEDEWGVAPSGRVAIVRALPYRLDWIELDGRTREGPVVAVQPVPVSEADRRLREPKGPPYRLTYPPTKGAFKGGLVIDPDDNVWVRRETPANATGQPWDVFSASGAHLGTVTLPSRERLIAISKRFVYVSDTDEDDLRWIEAYAR